MHKLVASLLLALSAAALFSQDAARATPAAASPHAVLLTTHAALAGMAAVARDDRAVEGAYFDLVVGEGLTVSYRVTELSATDVLIDAIVVREGRAIAEPSVRMALGATGSVALAAPPLALEFRVDANPASN